MTAYANTAEGGTSGTTVTTANSGGASGDAWDAVNIGTGAAITFDNAQAAHGSLSYKLVRGSTGGQTCSVQKAFPAASSTMAFRAYYYIPANPSANTNIAAFLGSATSRATLRLSSAGKLVLLSAASAGVIFQTGTVPLNQWFRVEIQFPVLSATVGQVTLARYDTPDSATPTETATSAATQNFGGTADTVSVQTTSVSHSLWFDDFAANDTGAAIGPVSLTPVDLQHLHYRAAVRRAANY